MNETNNRVILAGRPVARPCFSHFGREGRYMTFPFAVERLSGAVDTLNVIASEALLEKSEIGEGNHVRIEGEVRSYNNRSGVGSKLQISVFAHSIETADCEDENEVHLIAAVCKTPVLRATPMGRSICDMLVAVNRAYGRSDYLPCILWGQTAEYGALIDVGSKVELSGRLQSRKYIKMLENERIERTAFEISVADIEVRDG